MEEKIWVAYLKNGEGWQVAEADPKKFRFVGDSGLYAITDGPDELMKTVYSEEQLYSDFEHAVAYINGDFLFAVEGRWTNS